ncbi:MAG: hypothetical protein RJA22_3254 [Verrucomicrobiota bacterium]
MNAFRLVLCLAGLVLAAALRPPGLLPGTPSPSAKLPAPAMPAANAADSTGRELEHPAAPEPQPAPAALDGETSGTPALEPGH